MQGQFIFFPDWRKSSQPLSETSGLGRDPKHVLETHKRVQEFFKFSRRVAWAISGVGQIHILTTKGTEQISAKISIHYTTSF